MNLDTPVSGRQFAKMVGVSESAVRKAIAGRSILNGCVDGKIIPSVAALEWGKEIREEFNTATPSPQKPATKKRTKPAPVIPTPDSIIEEIMNEPLPGISKKDVDDDDEESGELHDGSPKHEAERKTAILKSRMLEIAYQEKKGDLIPRAKIATVLFAYGAEIRVAMEGITNRILDDILAVSDDRAKAKRLLDEEIYRTLNSISDNDRILF